MKINAKECKKSNACTITKPLHHNQDFERKLSFECFLRLFSEIKNTIGKTTTKETK